MGSNGGDGGTVYDQYFGRGMPELILYTDGRLLRGRWEDIRGRSYTESYLTEEQQCALLAQVAETGFLEIPFDGFTEEIYEFDETTQFSDGAGYQTILINGETPKGIHVYGPYMQYAITEVRMVYDLLENLNPPAVPYQPESLLLWIETGVGQGHAYLEEQITPTPWPSDLPSLHTLHAYRSIVPYRVFSQDTLVDVGGVVFVYGENVVPIWNTFGRQTGGGWFVEEDKLFFVVARLLLPHEQGITWVPREPYRFSLPFECAGD